jgi:hypothetical protein
MSDNILYTVKSEIGSGGYNRIYECIDTNGKTFLLRIGNDSSSISRNDALFDQFFENFKHLILYILIRSQYTNIKLIPQIYLLGYCNNRDCFITIMEYGG